MKVIDFINKLNSKKGFSPILIVVAVALLAIPVTTVLVQKQQDLRQRAAEVGNELPGDVITLRPSSSSKARDVSGFYYQCTGINSFQLYSKEGRKPSDDKFADIEQPWNGNCPGNKFCRGKGNGEIACGDVLGDAQCKDTDRGKIYSNKNGSILTTCPSDTSCLELFNGTFAQCVSNSSENPTPTPTTPPTTSANNCFPSSSADFQYACKKNFCPNGWLESSNKTCGEDITYHCCYPEGQRTSPSSATPTPTTAPGGSGTAGGNPKPTPPSEPGFCAKADRTGAKGTVCEPNTFDPKGDDYCRSTNNDNSLFWLKCASSPTTVTPSPDDGSLSSSRICQKSGLKFNGSTPLCGGKQFDMAEAKNGTYCTLDYEDVYECNDGTKETRKTAGKDNPCAGPVWCPKNTPTTAPGAPTPDYTLSCPGSTSTCEDKQCSTIGKQSNTSPGADKACSQYLLGKDTGKFCCLKPSASSGGATNTPTPTKTPVSSPPPSNVCPRQSCSVDSDCSGYDVCENGCCMVSLGQTCGGRLQCASWLQCNPVIGSSVSSCGAKPGATFPTPTPNTLGCGDPNRKDPGCACTAAGNCGTLSNLACVVSSGGSGSGCCDNASQRWCAPKPGEKKGTCVGYPFNCP